MLFERLVGRGYESVSDGLSDRDVISFMARASASIPDVFSACVVCGYRCVGSYWYLTFSVCLH